MNTKLWVPPPPPTPSEEEEAKRRAQLFNSEEFKAYKAGWYRHAKQPRSGILIAPDIFGYFLEYKDGKQ
jgi:hypothetical protein